MAMTGSGGGSDQPAPPEPKKEPSPGGGTDPKGSDPQVIEHKAHGQYKPPPRGDLTGEIKATRVKGLSERKRWKDADGNVYEWDSQHGKLEKYNKPGKHMGEFDHVTGEQTKPGDPARKVVK
jgi:hypothetical protein